MSERPRSNDIRPHMRQPTPTTDRDELVDSVIERFRWRVERKQFAPSVAEDLTLMMDRIQADAATIAGMREVVAWVAGRPTIAESMERDWPMADMTPEQRIEKIGQNKREHDAMVLKARALKGGDHG